MRIQASRVLQTLTYAVSLTLCNHLPSLYDSLPHTDASSPCLGSDSLCGYLLALFRLIPRAVLPATLTGYSLHLVWTLMFSYLALSYLVALLLFAVALEINHSGRGRRNRQVFP